MRVLFIGGTGNISAACSRRALSLGMEVFVLNRGRRKVELPKVKTLNADINDRSALESVLGNLEFDAVANFIAFRTTEIERDMELFAKRARQYIFISSASVYEKPPRSAFITEQTPRENPFWDYSRAKIECEQLLLRAHRESGFPATVVRPSLTYDRVIPLPFASWNEWTLIDRMLRGERIVVHGDGTSLWTITHAEDFALGFTGLLGNSAAVGEAFHITSDEVLTWDQIHQATAAAVGAEARIVHITSEDICALYPGHTGSLLGDKSYSLIFDNSKIKKFVPEFRATIPFADGIRRTLDGFKTDPARLVISESSNRELDHLLSFHDTRLRPV